MEIGPQVKPIAHPWGRKVSQWWRSYGKYGRGDGEWGSEGGSENGTKGRSLR
jgi:hypothetical protein